MQVAETFHIYWDDFAKSITFDAAMEEGHDAAATLTEHNIEDGSVINDHVIIEPVRLTVTGWITNTPIETPFDQMAGITGGFETVELNATSPSAKLGVGPVAIPLPTSFPSKQEVFRFSGAFDRIKLVRETLLALMRSGELLTLTTTYEDYSNMVLVSITQARNVDSKDASQFILSFQQATIATTETATAALPKIQSAKPPVNKQPKEITEGTAGSQGVKQDVGLLEKLVGF